MTAPQGSEIFGLDTEGEPIETPEKAELKESLRRKQPKTITELHATYKHWLHIEDTDLIDVALAASLDRKIPGDPVWLMIVAPSGGLKSEVLASLLNLEWCMELDNLTSRSIVSGRTKGDKMEAVTGLAREANGKVVIFKDFTELLSKERTERGEIISQFRTWYDGTVARRYGSLDKVVKVESTIGLLVGVTPAIDLYTATLGVLGERFVKLRYKQNREKSRKKAMETLGNEHDMRQELRNAVRHYVSNLKLPARADEMPQIPPGIKQAISNLAELTALARTMVPKGLGDHGNVEVDIQPEHSTRIVKQLLKLAQLLAIVRQRSQVTTDELRTVARVAEDSCIPFRLQILKTMLNESLTGHEIAQRTSIPKATVYRALENLELLGFATYEEHQEGSGAIRRYQPTPTIKNAINAVYDFTDSKETLRLVHGFLQDNAQDRVSPSILTRSYPDIQPCKKTWTPNPPSSSTQPPAITDTGSHWRTCRLCNAPLNNPDDAIRHNEQYHNHKDASKNV